MTKKWIALLASTAAGLLFAVAALAASGGPVQQAGNDLSDQASLQRGATAYMNYCSGCHSLKFLRYQRMAEDLGLTEEEVMGNLNFTGAKYGEHIQVTMRNADGAAWFGNAPPDLSLISRVRGSNWIYTYLKSFYLDDTRPLGWNNQLFPNVSMPNPLWELQGEQRPLYNKVESHGQEVEMLRGWEQVKPGTMAPAQFDQNVGDLVAYLQWMSEPGQNSRVRIGVWVMLFLAVFTVVAWRLNAAFWKDIK